MTTGSEIPGEQQAAGPLAAPSEGAAPSIAAGISRGVTRLLLAHGFVSLAELPLPDGHRADIVGLGGDGTIVVVEIKSSVADFRADQKWPAYLGYCDAFYFAVEASFPAAILPLEAGLILADRFGGAFARECPGRPRLSAPRRKAVTLRFAEAAATRLIAVTDPGARPFVSA